ncbi:MAG: hypothetical protein JXA69_02445, partial [Phycisphaerae bacterium]|nr:hypothetical protein [Phycisphaerae bacterium]
MRFGKKQRPNDRKPRGRKPARSGELTQFPYEQAIPQQSRLKRRPVPEPPPEPTSPEARLRRTVAWLVLGAYVALLVWRAMRASADADLTDVTPWELQDSRRLVLWLQEALVAGLLAFLRFIPIGLLTMLGLRIGRSWRQRTKARLAAVATAMVLTAGIRGLEVGDPWLLPGPLSLSLPILGCLLGHWIAASWLRGRQARRWLLIKLAGGVVVVGGAGAIVAALAVDEAPLPFEAPKITSEEKRRLVRMIRNKSPRNLKEGELRTLRLTEHDLDVLLAWGLSLGSSDRKACVNLAKDFATLSVSIGVPPGASEPSYINLVGKAQVRVAGEFSFLRAERLQVGRIAVSGWLARFLSNVVTADLRRDRRTQPFLAALRSIVIEPDAVSTTYGRLDLPSSFREDVFGTDPASEAVLAAAETQVAHLAFVAKDIPLKNARLAMFVEAAFALARDRSTTGDPVAENRAAIYALSVLLGHPGLQEFIGSVGTDAIPREARWRFGRAVLRGRRDWARHFFVSAGVALMSTESVSDAAGLLKE